MKLNLGCGGVYRRGYLNVDAFDDVVADRMMSAVDLDIEDDSVEEIEALQLIEHLGFTSSIYALSECFRVLKPGGKLVIETPDIKTSFKIYLKGGRERRKNILPWIYGVETPGMQHRFCFPDDLLEETFEKIGFVDIEKEFFEIEEYQPTLKVVCRKPEECFSPQFIAVFRKKLMKNNLVNLENQLLTLEQENLIDFFASKLRCLKDKTDGVLDEVLTEGCVHSPKITRVFLDEIVDWKIIPKEKIKDHLDVVDTLIDLDFPSILCYTLRQIPDFVGEQKKLFQVVVALGKTVVKKLLGSSEKSSVVDSLSKTRREIEAYDETDFFSEKILLYKANRLFQRGAKEFILGRYDEAIEYFKTSVELYRNQVLSYWNLGRLFVLKNNIRESENYYKSALNLLTKLSYRKKEVIRECLENEMKKLSKEKPTDPLFSLKEFFHS